MLDEHYYAGTGGSSQPSESSAPVQSQPTVTETPVSDSAVAEPVVSESDADLDIDELLKDL